MGMNNDIHIIKIILFQLLHYIKLDDTARQQIVGLLSKMSKENDN
jgi:hypothetical protein